MAEPPDSWTFEAQPLPEPSIQGAAPAAPNPAPAAGPAAPTSFLAPPQAPDELGRFGTYRILEVLGQGGMGVVFRAAEAVTGRTVALKVLRPEVARLPLAKKRFLREARAATGLPPDHVVAIFHVGEEAGLPYLAMEFLPGESLETYLRRSPQVSLDFLLRVGRETAAGLAAAHERGLIHRDVKPGNLWLTQPGGCVKILDFGLVHVLDASMRLTNTGQILGTPSYMAPEQAAGEKLDARADLYSLGVVLYRLCTGRLPIQGLNLFTLVTAIAYQEPPPIRDLNPAIPAAVADLVHRLLAKEPDQRPASAAEVAAALRRLEAAPAPPAEPPPVRNRTARAWWGAGAGLAVAVFLAALLWPARPPEPVASATATVAATAPAATAIPTGADRLRAEDVPAGLRSLHGDGHPERVPEVVAVLGTDQLRVHGQVEALAFHPKAPLLAAGTWARTNPRLGSVHFFDPRTAGPTRPALTGLPGWVRAFAFDPTGRYLAVARQNQPIALYDAATGEPAAEWRSAAPGRTVAALAFTRDGTRLAAGWDTGLVQIGTVPGGQELRTFNVATHPWVTQLAFSPDEQLLAVASEQGAGIEIHDAATGALARTLGPKTGFGLGLAFHPRRPLLASAHADRQVRLWDAETGAEVTALPWPGDRPPRRVDFSPDGQLLAAVDAQERVRVWRVEGWLPVAAFGGGGSFYDGVNEKAALAFSPDGQILATAGTARAVRLWDTTTWKERSPGAGHHGPVNAVAASPDGRRLASAGVDGTLRLWDLATGRQERLVAALAEPARTVAWSPDGRAAAVAGGDAVGVYDPATGQERLRRSAPGGRFAAAAFGPTWVGAAGGDGKLHRWDAATGAELPALALHNGAVQGLALSPDGNLLASVADRAVRLWHVADGAMVAEGRAGAALARVAFAEGGRQLLAVGAGREVWRWEVEPWRELPAWTGHDHPGLTGLAVHPGGRLIATGGRDGTVRLGRADGGPAIAAWPLAPPGLAVAAVAFTPEGRHLVTGRPDGTLVVLRLRPEWLAP